MKRILFIAAMSALAGCIDDPSLAVEAMKGSGSVTREADGSTSFRYAIQGNAYNGVIKSDADLKAQHKWLIGSFLGNGGYCPRGYVITSDMRDHGTGIYLYEGKCK